MRNILIIVMLGVLQVVSLCGVAGAQPTLVLPPAPAGVETSTQYGIAFSTIGSPGNSPPSIDNPWGPPLTRGRVDYDYRIARSELTTAQWIEFVNTFTTRGDMPGRVAGEESFLTREPAYYGGVPDFDYQGPGRRYRVLSGQENLPVLGMSWRSAAMYCNWLHNDRSSELSSLWSGAYDTSTWTDPRGSSPYLNDEINHSPDARFWIPTQDEWQKAAFYDPNKDGNGNAGWWTYTNRSDDIPISGLPGEGTTIQGVPLQIAIDIPLGSYGDLQSPWGLIDTAAGGREWLEDVFPIGAVRGRYTDRGVAGGYATGPQGAYSLDNSVFGPSSLNAWGWTTTSTLRIAARVPSPSSVALVGCFVCVMSRRRSIR